MSDQPQKVDQTQRMLDSFDNKFPDRYPLENYDAIGKRGVLRNDGVEKATGAARYTIDVQLPGMLHARFLTSPHPHAEIKSMDTSEAEKMPGVRCILRYDDPELHVGVATGGHELNAELPLPSGAHFQGEECGALSWTWRRPWSPMPPVVSRTSSRIRTCPWSMRRSTATRRRASPRPTR